MSDWWSPLISSVAGLAGVTIGAWLTGRREKWERKRQIYADVLKALSDSFVGAQTVAEVCRLTQSPSSAAYDKQVLDELYKEKLEQAVKAQQAASQTIAIAQILLPTDAVEVLHRFDTDWAAASGDIGEVAAKRVKICERAKNDLVPIARRDLGSWIG